MGSPGQHHPRPTQRAGAERTKRPAPTLFHPVPAFLKMSMKKQRLHVSYTEAHRLRQILLSAEIEMLHKKDVRALLTILDDVYPAPIRAHSSLITPIFAGIGIGMALVLIVAMFW